MNHSLDNTVLFFFLFETECLRLANLLTRPRNQPPAVQQLRRRQQQQQQRQQQRQHVPRVQAVTDPRV